MLNYLHEYSSNAKNYKDNFKNEGWIHATWLACALLTTSSESDYVSLFGKPQGINSQLYFTGSNYFYNNCQMKNGQLQYHNGNNWVNAYDVVIVGSTLSSSNLIVNKTNVNSHKSSSKNIYFNI